jgi:hypothetical protein
VHLKSAGAAGPLPESEVTLGIEEDGHATAVPTVPVSLGNGATTSAFVAGLFAGSRGTHRIALAVEKLGITPAGSVIADHAEITAIAIPASH